MLIRLAPLLAPLFPLALAQLATAQTAAPELQIQDSATQPPASSSPERVAVSRYTEPRPKKVSVANAGLYPAEAKSRGEEGLVTIEMMVDAKGKPYEVVVVDAVGSKAFQNAALKIAESAVFEPATLDGKPIDASVRMPLRFFLRGNGSPGASRDFIRNYESLLQAVRSDDRIAADKAMASLHATNLYENAYVGLGVSAFAHRWGDPEQELAALKRATGESQESPYLPPDLFRTALLARLRIEISTLRYAEALTTWKRVEKPGADARSAPYLAAIDELRKLQEDGRRYSLSGSTNDEGIWFLKLFKRHFQAAVEEGHIENVKLRCEKGFLVFKLDPALAYDVPVRLGACSLMLEGVPGTRFTFSQS